MVEDPHTAVDDPELLVDVEVGDDAGKDPGDVKDVQHRDGDQAGCEQGAEVPCLPVLDLEFHVTENTVWMDDPRIGTQKAQAATFRAIVTKLAEHSKRGVVVWNVWQLCDSHIQRPQKKGTMFDASFQPKQSYYAVQNVLRDYSEAMEK